MAHLEFVNGPLEGDQARLPTRGIVVIGRDAEADLTIDDQRVSRRHCAVEVTDEGTFVADIASKNGTFLNENKIKREPLQTGDRIRIGYIEIIATVDAPQPRPRKRSIAYDETKGLGGELDVITQCDICQAPISLAMVRQNRSRRILDWMMCPDCVDRMESFQLNGIIGVEMLQRLLRATEGSSSEHSTVSPDLLTAAAAEAGKLPRAARVDDAPKDENAEGSTDDALDGLPPPPKDSDADSKEPSMTQYIRILRRRLAKRAGRRKRFAD